jgi:hypothetical protein
MAVHGRLLFYYLQTIEEMLLVSLSFKWKGPADVLVSPSQTGDDTYSIVFVLCMGLMSEKH